MTYFDIPIGELYKDWETVMEVTLDDSALTFTEHLHNPDFNVAVTARTLTVPDFSIFQKATRTSEEDLEWFLIEKKGNMKLSIEAMQRLCERHKIPYDITGDRPATAHRKYVKWMQETKDRREAKAMNLCSKALHRMTGKLPGTPENHEQATALFKEAIALGYLPAFAYLAMLYERDGLDKEAMETVNKGVKHKDARSMILLARWLCKDPHCDYSRAAELFISASEKGEYRRASKGLHRLITDGNYTPKGDLFMKLIICAARSKKESVSSDNNNIPFNPELRRARDILMCPSPDIPAARELLNRALLNGNTLAYSGLAKCDILEKRWGSAAENVMKAIEAGHTSSCLIYAARLALEGADFRGFTDSLGEPDYEAVIRWSIRCIEEDVVYGFRMLDYLANHTEIGVGIVNRVQNIIDDEEECITLFERYRYYCYCSNIPKDKLSDIYCAPFDGERQTKTTPSVCQSAPT